MATALTEHVLLAPQLTTVVPATATGSPAWASHLAGAERATSTLNAHGVAPIRTVITPPHRQTRLFVDLPPTPFQKGHTDSPETTALFGTFHVKDRISVGQNRNQFVRTLANPFVRILNQRLTLSHCFIPVIRKHANYIENGRVNPIAMIDISNRESRSND